MDALILAAGLGTRLKPLTDKIAKPALPIQGVPALWFSVFALQKSLGLQKAFINIGHLPETIKKVCADSELQKKMNFEFTYSDESSEILGSSGALYKLREEFFKTSNEKSKNDSLLVINADALFFPPWKELVEQHKKTKADLTLHLSPFESANEGYTDFEISENGLVKSMGKKTKKGIFFTGAYIVSKKILSRLPAGKSELKATLLDPLLKEQKLFAYVKETAWLDIGNITSYNEAQAQVLKKIPEFKELIKIKNQK